jgi:hypothetical protein
MHTPKRTLSRPTNAKYLAFETHITAGGSTRDQLVTLIEPYTDIRPVLPQYFLSRFTRLASDLDNFGRAINRHWQLQGNQQFFQNEIKTVWQVHYLAAYIDLKKAKQP